MKHYNCPDCEVRLNTCEACQRYYAAQKYNGKGGETWFSDKGKIVHIPLDFPDSIIWTKDSNIPDCCKHCNAHPTNGGSGICNCTLPYITTTEL